MSAPRDLRRRPGGVHEIWGNKVAPWLAERHLARTAVVSQQTDRPVLPDRPDNLFDPAPGDPGAHGQFDRRAHPRSLQLWATKHRAWPGPRRLPARRGQAEPAGALAASASGSALSGSVAAPCSRRRAASARRGDRVRNVAARMPAAIVSEMTIRTDRTSAT